MSERRKQVAFSVTETAKARFKVQLHYDGLTQKQFLEGVMEAYASKEENFMNFVDGLKTRLKAQSNKPIANTKRNRKEALETQRKFALSDDEIENIFDILEQEHPDL